MQCENDVRCADQIRRILSEEVVNSIAKEVGFCKRLRKLTPLRTAWVFLVGLGSGTADTLADFVRLFADLTGTQMRYKPFHDRLSTRAFPEFLRRLCEVTMSELIGPILTPQGGVLSQFDDIWIQDGSSFALNDRLASTFRGRFTKISPAAAEVHCTYSLFEGQAVSLSVAPDSQGERDFLPAPQELAGKLLLVDRGYVSYDYFGEVDAHGGSFICRAKDKRLNPVIVTCRRGVSNKDSLIGKKLKEVALPKRSVDLIIEAKGTNGVIQLRLVLFWVAKKKKHIYLFTNLSAQQFLPEVVATTYRLRWQVELFFKECKSFTSLQKFQTANPHIAEGLIWGTLLAILVRRYLNYSTHETRGHRSAPLVTASVSWMFFRDLGRTAVRGYRHFRRAIAEVLQLLRDVASRTNTQRRTPFEELGIVPLLAVP